MQSRALNPEPYCVQTRRLTLRAWNVADASAWRRLLDRSDQHLRPWIPWMNIEPRSLEDTTAWVREQQDNFLAAKDFRYPIFERESGELIGETGLYTRCGADRREIGYMIDVNSTGKGYALEAGLAMVNTCFRWVGVELMELHCASDNAPSIAMAERLGFSHAETHPGKFEGSDGQHYDSMVWRQQGKDFAGNPDLRISFSGYDINGEKLFEFRHDRS